MVEKPELHNYVSRLSVPIYEYILVMGQEVRRVRGFALHLRGTPVFVMMSADVATLEKRRGERVSSNENL